MIVRFAVRPGADRVRPRDVAHDDDPAVLEVDRPGVLAAVLDDDAAHEPDRRPEVERAPSEVLQEQRSPNGHRHRFVEGDVCLEVARDATEVEDDRQLLARLGALFAHPEVEPLHPLVQRQAERVVRRHHVAPTPGDPGGLQTRGHELGKRRQRRIRRVSVAVERDGVILVGSDRLLLAGGAAQGEPCPRHRRLTVLRDPELEQPARGGVDRERDHVPDVDRVGARVDERGDHVGELRDRARDRLAIGRAFDRALQRERCVATDPHQVRVSDHADDPSAGVRDREVVEATLEHAEQDLADHRVGGHGLGSRRHHIADRGVAAPSFGDDPRSKIAIGEDADGAVGRGDQQARHAFARHALGGLGDGVAGSHVTGSRRTSAPTSR